MSEMKAIDRDEAAIAAMTPAPWVSVVWRQTNASECQSYGIIINVPRVALDHDVALLPDDADGIARLRNRMPLYVRYFRAVEARDRHYKNRANGIWAAAQFSLRKEVAAARKALLEDTDGT